jgi:hypothetical protein
VEPSAIVAQTFRRNLTVTYAIAAAVWLVAGALLFALMALFLSQVLASNDAGGLWAVILAPVLAPVPITVAIWLLLRAAHVPKAFLVSLLGTLLWTAGTVGLVLLIVQAGLAAGAFWLVIALLLPASYVLIGRLVFPLSPER